MPRTPPDASLARSVERFKNDVRRFAHDLARSVLETEFARASAAAVSTAAKPRKRRKTKNAVAPVPPAAPTKAAVSAPSRSRDADPADVEPTQSPREWTREGVIAELGQWLITSKDVDAAFLKRHGPRGLVDAAKRIFGRFDAALNAANLAIAPRMEQKGRGARSLQDWPSMRELAQRQRARRAAALSTTTAEPSHPTKV